MTEIYDWAKEGPFVAPPPIEVAEEQQVIAVELEAPQLSTRTELRRELSGLWDTFKAVGAVVGVLVISLNVLSPEESSTDSENEQPPEVSLPNVAKESLAVKGTDVFRYDYRGTSLICSVGPPHTIQSGDTLYGLVASKYPQSEDATNYLLPAIKRLNVEREKVEDPDELKLDTEVLTFDECELRGWWYDEDPSDGYTWVRYLDHGVHESYSYDFVAKQYLERLNCWGDEEYCADTED